MATLGPRALNRATLARQSLLERSDSTASDMIEHLVGMQAQLPPDPYIGLWSRVTDFDVAELSALMLDRKFARASVMRGTIHLLSMRDCLAIWPLTQIVLARAYKSGFGKPVRDLDIKPMLEFARELMNDRPRTRAEFRQAFAEKWPEIDSNALSWAISYLQPVVQVTPRGVWRRSLQPTLTTFESWFGRDVDGEPTIDDIVRRYLRAYGPASVKDVQSWSGLTRLREVVDRLRPELQTFRSVDGAELFDFPDSPRPAPDIPAPVRYLPVYDNVLLGFADRQRFIPEGRKPTAPFAGPDANYGGLLVDGMHCGLWKQADTRLDVQLLGTVSKHDRSAIVEEGQRLLAFLTDGPTEDFEVRFVGA